MKQFTFKSKTATELFGALSDRVFQRAREVTRETFLKNCEVSDKTIRMSAERGYKNRYEFYKSRYNGIPVYYYRYWIDAQKTESREVFFLP